MTSLKEMSRCKESIIEVYNTTRLDYRHNIVIKTVPCLSFVSLIRIMSSNFSVVLQSTCFVQMSEILRFSSTLFITNFLALIDFRTQRARVSKCRVRDAAKCQSHQSCRSSSRWSNTQSMSYARAPRPSSLSVSRTILKSSASSDDRTNDIWVVPGVTNACIVSRVVKALVRSLVTDHGAKAVAILPLQIPAHCVFCLL